MIRFIGSNTIHYTSEKASLVFDIPDEERIILHEAVKRPEKIEHGARCVLQLKDPLGCFITLAFTPEEADALRKDLEIQIRKDLP